jgi:hypothetical protein
VPEARPWWPLRLAPSECESLAAFRTGLATSPAARLHEELNATIADDLWISMAGSLPTILERDTLPDVAHVLNGWGDLSHHGRRISEYIAPFAQRTPDRGAVILQKDPEGEFHPWQTFAYAVMAGADVDAPLGARVPSIRDLAHTSRRLNTSDACEMGHLLFALAFLDPSLRGPPFVLRNGTYDVQDLMRSAIVAHYAGHFRVCRKIHLTEGICAMAARVPGMATFRRYAQRFLDGQMEMLVVLGAIVEQAYVTATALQPARTDVLVSLRNQLRIGTYLENHCYYAGHLIELACFAGALGYVLRPEHRAAAALVANRLNTALAASLPLMSFMDCFLHLGHYRRAITLLPGFQKPSPRARFYTRGELAAFALDIHATTQLPALRCGTVRTPFRGLWPYAVMDADSSRPRPRFREVFDLYARIAAPGFEPRGGFPHFRRMGPPSWPRAMHYELLDYGDAIGVEVHLEGDSVAPMAEVLRSTAARMAPVHADRTLEWDPHWYRGRGRLRLLLDDHYAAADIANCARKLIDRTFPTFDQVAAELAERDPLHG